LVVIAEEVKRTPPKGDPKGAMFYTLDGEMHERDPRQPELPVFRVVDNGDGSELRDPGEAAGQAREAE